jgi:hypothetical protein
MKYQVNITRVDHRPVGKEIMPKLAEFLKGLGIYRQINGFLNVSGGI